MYVVAVTRKSLQ